MNKQELIEAIANEVEVTKATAAGCLDAFINAKRKATTGRNPQTGAPIKIAASTQPKFRPGKSLKEALN